MRKINGKVIDGNFYFFDNSIVGGHWYKSWTSPFERQVSLSWTTSYWQANKIF